MSDWSRYKEVERYIKTMPGCCVIRVIGHDDGPEQEAAKRGLGDLTLDEDYRMRFVEIDLLTTHEQRMPWKRRLITCWDTLRHGRAVERYFIEFYSREEADEFITATIEATRVAFYSDPEPVLVTAI